jgi:hypothetical protein
LEDGGPVSGDLVVGRFDGTKAGLLSAMAVGGGLDRGSRPRGRRGEHAKAGESAERFFEMASLGFLHGDFSFARFLVRGDLRWQAFSAAEKTLLSDLSLRVNNVLLPAIFLMPLH